MTQAFSRSSVRRAPRWQLAVAVMLAGALTSCAAIDRNPRTAKGTAIGAAAGAGTGAAVGAVVGGGKAAGKGAAIGAVLGALGGAAVGQYMDQQANELERVISDQDDLRRNQQQGLNLMLDSDVLFATGQATLQPGGRDKLARIAGVLQRYPETRLEILGHTDSSGSSETNQELSERRAEAVAAVLSGHGISPSRMTVHGFGESRPVATNETAVGRSQNRRVEIVMTPTTAGTSAGDAPTY